MHAAPMQQAPPRPAPPDAPGTPPGIPGRRTSPNLSGAGRGGAVTSRGGALPRAVPRRALPEPSASRCRAQRPPRARPGPAAPHGSCSCKPPGRDGQTAAGGEPRRAASRPAGTPCLPGGAAGAAGPPLPGPPRRRAPAELRLPRGPPRRRRRRLRPLPLRPGAPGHPCRQSPCRSWSRSRSCRSPWGVSGHRGRRAGGGGPARGADPRGGRAQRPRARGAPEPGAGAGSPPAQPGRRLPAGPRAAAPGAPAPRCLLGSRLPLRVAAAGGPLQPAGRRAARAGAQLSCAPSCCGTRACRGQPALCRPEQKCSAARGPSATQNCLVL